MNIFYTTHCPKCKVLEQKLQEKKIEYITCEDIDKMLELDIMAAPAFYTDETGLMDFSAALQWVREAPDAN